MKVWLVKWALCSLTAVGLLAAFAWFIYPTPFFYYVDDGQPERVSRSTGRVETCGYDRWMFWKDESDIQADRQSHRPSPGIKREL